MIDLFLWLADPAPFLDRWHCVRADPVTGRALIFANAATWLIYWLFAVPLVRVYRAHRGKFGAAWLLAGAAAFIFLCGGHHALYVLAFRWPCYRLAAAVDVLMALVSVAVLIAFWASSRALCLARPASEVDAERDEWAALVDRRDREIRDLEGRSLALVNSVADLRARVDIYEARFGRERSTADLSAAIQMLIGQLPEDRGGPDHDG